jgi:hypothetical protein
MLLISSGTEYEKDISRKGFGACTGNLFISQAPSNPLRERQFAVGQKITGSYYRGGDTRVMTKLPAMRIFQSIAIRLLKMRDTINVVTKARR